MGKFIYKMMLVLFSMAAVGAAMAAEATVTPAPQAADTPASQDNYQTANTTLVRDYCPPVDTLVRNEAKQSWGTPTGWRTTSPSFLYSLDAFVGAQWVGVSVGEIICVYTKTGRSSFPVTLQQGKLVPAPKSGGQWSTDKGGYMECKSSDPQDCFFFLQVPKAAKNVYDEIDFYKDKPTESS